MGGGRLSEALGEEEKGCDAMEDGDEKAAGDGATVSGVNFREETKEQGDVDGEGGDDDGEDDDDDDDDDASCCRMDCRCERDFGVIIFITFPILTLPFLTLPILPIAVDTVGVVCVELESGCTGLSAFLFSVELGTITR